MGATLACSVALLGAPASAAPASADGEQTPAQGDEAPDERRESDSEASEGEASEGEASGDELQPTVGEVETAPPPSGGGVAGAIVDPNDPNATRAQSDLEGESLDTDIEGLPERLPKLQAAAWWTTFGAVALATAGGVFAGVAEARQDQADRLAYGFDLDTGRAQLYGEVEDEYEQLLADGVLYQNLARGFIIAGGATLIVGIVLFSVEGARRNKAERAGPNTPASDEARARVVVEPGAGGLRLRF